MANIKRLRKVVEYIEKMTSKPKTKFVFDMRNWHKDFEANDTAVTEGSYKCGTNMCLAGWAVHRKGLKVVVTSAFGDPLVIPKGKVHDGTERLTTDGELMETVEDWAARYFDLSSDDVESIFYATEIEDIHMLKSHINGVLRQPVFEDVEWLRVYSPHDDDYGYE